MIKYLPFSKFDRLVRKLRRMIRRGSRVQRRDALAMVLGLHGLRITEVCRLKCSDLDELEEMLSVATLKGGKPRRISLGVGVYRELRKLTHKRPSDAPLLGTSSGGPLAATWLRRVCDEVIRELFGVSLKFHGLRHTYAMRLYHSTRDMQRVKARLGHRSLASTQVYVDAYGELTDPEIKRIGEIEVLPRLRKPRGRRARRKNPGSKSANPADEQQKATLFAPVILSIRQRNASKPNTLRAAR